MIVTTGTGNRQSLKGFAHHIDLVVLVVRFVLQNIGWPMGGVMKVPKARANDRFIVIFFGVPSGIFQKVTGEVLTNKIVVGNILIECPDEVVPVFVGMIDPKVEFMSIGVRVPNKVHPVPGPLFSKMSGGKQFIDDLLFGLFKRFCELLRGGGQADEVKVDPSCPCALVCGQGRLQANVFHFFLYKAVDRRSRFVVCFGSRDTYCLDGSPAPVFGKPFRQVKFFHQALFFFHLGAGIRSPHRHPFFQNRNFFVFDFVLRGHRIDQFLGVPHRINDHTFHQISRNDRRSAHASGCPPPLGIEKEFTL